MRKFAIPGLVAFVVAVSTAVYAQYQHRHGSHERMRINPENRTVFTEVRIAAAHSWAET